MACATLKSGGPSPGGKVFGVTIAQLSTPPGGRPNAPHMRLNAPRSVSNTAVIAVAVGDEYLVGAGSHPRVRCAVHVRCIGIALALVTLADLQHEFAVEREFE